jgi:hypothetical protein
MKNLEIKTKRMSLTNIEGKLSLTEMETIMAGSGVNGAGCFFAGATIGLFWYSAYHYQYLYSCWRS